MDTNAAFFSYSHFDDEHDGANLSRLRMNLAAEIQMQTGTPFEIFQDRTDILIGQRWRERIVSSIDSSTLLIAVLTPSFFRSDECRREVQQFLDRETRLQRNDLIVPIYYVECSEIEDDASTDRLTVELRTRQYVDWREHRFQSQDGTELRRVLAELARQIVEISRAPIVRIGPPPADELSEHGRDDPGAVELLAGMEEAFPIMVSRINEMAEEVTKMGSISNSATEEINRAANRSNPSRGKLAAIQRYTKRLSEPADRIEILAAEYRDELLRVDAGVDGMAKLLQISTDETELETAYQLRHALGEMSKKAHEGIDSTLELVSTMTATEDLSSTVRPVYRRITTALNSFADSMPIIQSWEYRIAEALDNLGESPNTM